VATRKQVKKNRRGAGSPWMWFFTGLLSGLLLMTLALQSGLLRMPGGLQGPTPDAEDPLEEAAIPSAPEPAEREYDFFQILPEQDIVVPESEVRREANRQAPVTGGEDAVYLLQVASLREADDADALKAQLLLLGMDTSIITVDVDGVTWHRVRVGPVRGARAASALRDRLAASGFDALILRGR
jgi:cell division protein FtsN